MQEALDELREALGSDRVPMADVVIRGAQEIAVELREAKDDKARRLDRLADRIRDRKGFDVDLAAAEEVRRTGWARPL